MKKNVSLVFGMALAASLLSSGCGSNEASAPVQNAPVSAPVSEVQKPASHMPPEVAAVAKANGGK